MTVDLLDRVAGTDPSNMIGGSRPDAQPLDVQPGSLRRTSALPPARRVASGLWLVVPLPIPLLVVVGFLSVAGVAGLAARSTLLGAAGVVAVSAGLWLAQRPRVLALVTVILVPVTSGLKRDLPIPGLRLSEALTVFAAVVVLGVFARQLPGPRWRSWDYAALAYCTGTAVFGLLDAFVHEVPITIEDARVIVGPLQFLMLYRVTAAAFPTVALRLVAMRGLLLASLPIAALAILQTVGPSVFQAIAVSSTGTNVFVTPGYDPVRRATSVFPIWHALAGYLLIVCLLAVALLLRRDRRVLPMAWLAVVLVTNLIALVYSLTATVMVGLVFGMLLLGWLNGRLVMVATGLVVMTATVLIAFFPLVSQRIDAQTTATAATPATGGDSVLPQTIQYRLDVWGKEYLPALRGSWINGYGPADPPNVTWQHTESGYLTLLLRGGLGYLAVAGVMLYLSWRSARRRLRVARAPSEFALAATVAALAPVLVVVNLAFPYLTASGLPQPMWVVWGLLAAAIGEGARDRVSPSSDRHQVKVLA